MNLLTNLLDIQGENGPALSNEFLSTLALVFVYIFALCAAVGVVYAMYLGLSLGIASDEQKRDKAKKRIMNVLASILIIIILTVTLFGVGAVDTDDVFNPGNNNRPPGNNLVDGDRVAEGSHWRMLGIIVREIDIRVPAPTINDPIRDINIVMDGWDINYARTQLNQLPQQLTEMSNGQMTGIMHIHVVDRWEPERWTYHSNPHLLDTSQGFMWNEDHQDYTLSSFAIGEIARPFLERSPGQFDHVTVFTRLLCYAQYVNIRTDWLGLKLQPQVIEPGVITYLPVGASTIQFPRNRGAWWWVNEFPTTSYWHEDTIVHEFIHTLERLAYRYGHISILEVIDNPIQFDCVDGWLFGSARSAFYRRFLNGELRLNGQPFGLRSESFALRYTERLVPF